MEENTCSGRQLALQALAGKSTQRVPAGPLTWGFEYLWKAAGLEPWQLACGSSETWQVAHLAVHERHHPDLLFYNGAGSGPVEPTLLEENKNEWIVRDNNSGTIYGLMKESLALYDLAAENRNQRGTLAPTRRIQSKEDADRAVPLFEGWGERYLTGLTRLIAEVGDRALVLPHHSPGYIVGCYTLGFEQAMEMMLFDPSLFYYICDRHAEGDELRMREWAEAGAEAVYIADGWASCDIISPVMFQQFALPYQVSITEAAHKAGLKIILWNEGDVLPILEQEASIPVDAFHFEQPRKGADLTVDKVRRVFGPERCLFGNIDSENMFLRNDPEEIRRCVLQQIRQSGEGAPFVLCTGSPLPSNIEPSAVDAMMQAAREFRF